ncbi:LysR substrate-binding domain-containing protein [Pseudomonas eucalypticola]|uniref:LysR family transcriptional regulator n=1 Tax=Pseudomonas eucalypticola TaxID=2599595 RepID=A0A7D5D7G2_9PSED|nr:LysR substrate-binding domain-containing protein [Pseudomonas eucalypticola]QKZ04656.1 LysR family transcriptional regulator [Pseudomonas eucalypticola]
MRHPTFDLDVLRTFVTGVELDSFAKAADRLGRSTSAVSAQLKKLEEQVGSPVLARSGRGLALTPMGELLLGHARRLLGLNDEIFGHLHATQAQGTLRLGLQEDFGERLLSDVLQRFTSVYPGISLEIRLGRSAELLPLVESARLDLALTWDTGASTPWSTRLGQTPTHWIGPGHRQFTASADNPLPLVLFDAPCVLRSAALQALDAAHIPWRIALTSPSVAGLWAAVSAGLGITLRTRVGLPAHLRVMEGLPNVAPLGYRLHRASETESAALAYLADLAAQALGTS